MRCGKFPTLGSCSPPLPGLVYWWRAGENITFFSGALVDTWTDKISGKVLGNTGTPSERPTQQVSPYNDQPEILFNGARAMVVAGIVLAQPFTLVLIGRQLAIQVGGRIIDAPGPQVILDQFQGCAVGANTLPGTGPISLAAGGSLQPRNGSAGINVPSMIIGAYSGAASTIEVNKGPSAVESPGTNGFSNGFTLGRFNGGASFYCNFAVQDLMIYSHVLTSAEKELL